MLQTVHMSFSPSVDAPLFDAEGSRVSSAGAWRMHVQYDGVGNVVSSNLTVTDA